MADKDKELEENPAQRVSRAHADAAAEAEARQADETVPGGRYKLSPDGPFVDANGNEIKG